MRPPIGEWDAAYVQQLLAEAETLDLEKKAREKFDPVSARNSTLAELAKQVCAFSNSGLGYLVYGVTDKGGLDAGVPEVASGNQPSKAWVEQVIPQHVFPPVHGCQARHIPIPGHHAAGMGVLVVEIPLSDQRPHWVTEGTREIPYIRAGEHSSPMRLQTFRDMMSRGSTPIGKVVDLGVTEEVSRELNNPMVYVRFNPIVEVTSGPTAEMWSLTLRAIAGQGNFHAPLSSNASIVEDHVMTLHGTRPLFPGHPARACTTAVTYDGIPVCVETLFSVGSSKPVKQELWFEGV